MADKGKTAHITEIKTNKIFVTGTALLDEREV